MQTGELGIELTVKPFPGALDVLYKGSQLIGKKIP